MPTETTRYRFAAWTVESAFAVPELPGASGDPDWRIECQRLTARDRHVHWHQRVHAADGQPWVWLGSRAEYDVARFPGRAWCIFDARARTIRCTWQREVSEDLRAQVLVNHVLPLAASRAGHLVLHGAVVRRPSGDAVAIVGEAGAGKSTLAGYLATRGWVLLSDDRVILDASLQALPVTPVLRLAPETAHHLALQGRLSAGHHKVRVRVDGGDHGWCAAPAPLGHVVILRRGDAPCITRLDGRQTLIEIVRAQLLLGGDRRNVRSGVFDMMSALIARVPCSRIDTRKRWDDLSVVASQLERGF